MSDRQPLPQLRGSLLLADGVSRLTLGGNTPGLLPALPALAGHAGFGLVPRRLSGGPAMPGDTRSGRKLPCCRW